MAKFTKLNIGDAVASSGGRVWKKLSAESATEDSIVGAWVFNENPDLKTLYDNGQFYDLTFESINGNSVRYNTGITIYKNTAYNFYEMWYVGSSSVGGSQSNLIAYGQNSTTGVRDVWLNDDYKTIEITEEADDEFFKTWLQANATKVS